MVAVAEMKEATILAVQRGQEVVVTRRNDVGILFQIATLLSENNVNVLGVSAGVCGEDCLIRLITDDNHKAEELLAANSFLPEENGVVLVDLPHRPGMLKQVTKVLTQEGIDIRHIYAAADPGQEKCLLVFHSSNDDVALTRLRGLQAGSFERTDAATAERQADQEQNANMVSEGSPTY